MKLNLDSLTGVLERDPRVLFAVLFGSSVDGTVRDDSDVDVGVLFSAPLSSVEFFEFYQSLVTQLPEIAELDLIDLHRASSVLAFESLCGRRLVVRDADRVAAFSSEIARQYEDDMFRAGVLHAA